MSVLFQPPISGFLRLTQIIGSRKAIPPIQPLIPVSRSTWYEGIKSGRFPAPVKGLGIRISLWKVEDIQSLINKIGLSATAEELCHD